MWEVAQFRETHNVLLMCIEARSIGETRIRIPDPLLVKLCIYRQGNFSKLQGNHNTHTLGVILSTQENSYCFTTSLS